MIKQIKMGGHGTSVTPHLLSRNWMNVHSQPPSAQDRTNNFELTVDINKAPINSLDIKFMNLFFYVDSRLHSSGNTKYHNFDLDKVNGNGCFLKSGYGRRKMTNWLFFFYTYLFMWNVWHLNVPHANFCFCDCFEKCDRLQSLSLLSLIQRHKAGNCIYCIIL